jgi:hypothetical protein
MGVAYCFFVLLFNGGVCTGSPSSCLTRGSAPGGWVLNGGTGERTRVMDDGGGWVVFVPSSLDLYTYTPTTTKFTTR